MFSHAIALLLLANDANGTFFICLRFSRRVLTNFKSRQYSEVVAAIKSRMTRKAKVKAQEKDWTKVNEWSPLQDDEF